MELKLDILTKFILLEDYSHYDNGGNITIQKLILDKITNYNLINDNFDKFKTKVNKMKLFHVIQVILDRKKKIRLLRIKKIKIKKLKQ